MSKQKPKPENDGNCPLSWSSHPESCSFMRIYCADCGFIGNTESLAHLPPCPWTPPADRKEP